MKATPQAVSRPTIDELMAASRRTVCGGRFVDFGEFDAHIEARRADGRVEICADLFRSAFEVVPEAEHRFKEELPHAERLHCGAAFVRIRVRREHAAQTLQQLYDLLDDPHTTRRLEWDRAFELATM